jgi:ubiquinone/menaquinone biosynthesis C-methylase UbiE
MRNSLLLLFLLLGSCASEAELAENSVELNPPEASVREGVNERFLDPELNVANYVDLFEGESREIAQSRDAILAALNLKPGMCVADIGAGTGLFMEGLAQAVGSEGKLFAVDISPGFLEHLDERAKQAGLHQVQVVQCSERSVELEPNSIDFALICDTYHHFEFPNSTMTSLRRALRPGGRLVVIDFERIEGVTREWLLEHVRASKEVFRSEIEAAGFVFSGEFPVAGLSENYVIQFQKIKD